MQTLETATFTGSLAELRKQWCVYEHYVQTATDAPPQCVFIGVCALKDVWSAPDAKLNSEWSKLYDNDTPLLVRLLHTGNITECLNRRAWLLSQAPQQPYCNMHGRSALGSTRAFLCSNGKTYQTQLEAAEDLGVAQGAISRVLRGQGRTAGGWSFTYVGD